MGVAAAGLPRDPAAVARGAGDAPVGRHGPLGHHVGAAGPDEVKEHRVQRVALLAQHAAHHLDASRLKAGKALASHQRVGVARPRHDPRHAGREQCIDAGRLLAVVGAGLQGHIRRGARGVLATPGAIGQGVCLGMGLSVALVPALADHTAGAHDHAAHQRVRVREARTPPGKLHRPGHEASLGAKGPRLPTVAKGARPPARLTRHANLPRHPAAGVRGVASRAQKSPPGTCRRASMDSWNALEGAPGANPCASANVIRCSSIRTVTVGPGIAPDPAPMGARGLTGLPDYRQ